MSYHSYADIGGEAGYGPVVPEPEGVVFHADWERQVLGLVFGILLTGTWSSDTYRSAFETLPNYSLLSYYQKWLGGLEKLLIEHGLVGADEIAAARVLHPPRELSRVPHVADIRKLFASVHSTERPASAPARFAVGDEVRARSSPADHHTRLPGYARGKRGRVESVHGAHIFPDTHAHGLGEQPQWLYTVVFTGHELWGEDAAPRLTVSIEAFEPYLEPV